MQQHLMQTQMQHRMAAYYHSNVTTDHIQQYLDENKTLILKIVESQNSGKLSECAENQARLQRNLMYLAAIADSHPQLPSMHSQYAGSGVLQTSPYLQHQQLQQMAPQSLMATRSSMLYGAQPYPSPQAPHIVMSPNGSSGLMMQGEPHGGVVGFPDFRGAMLGMGGGGKQDTVEGPSGPEEGN